jgi:hypothetical protein
MRAVFDGSTVMKILGLSVLFCYLLLGCLASTFAQDVEEVGVDR